jgi:GNAT superfamily N-acetyltransferase
MNGQSEPLMVVETNPSPNDARFLEEQLYDFGMQATGIGDGALFGVFLRGPDARAIGGAYGWTWGGTCYVRYLFVPADMRGQGHGTRLMRAVEQEAMARGVSKWYWKPTIFRVRPSIASSASPSSARSKVIRAGTNTSPC